ncbi:MAG: HD domain-containing protein [Balneolales bacterium]
MYKIFTDPVHGFVNVPKGILLKLVDHPYVQRLRRIRQLGLGYLVFPGAEHSRFSHAIGTLGLANRALMNLREKKTTITHKEYEGTLIAILLHDIGHGPFSHTLEKTFIHHFNHEMMTLAFMHDLNREFKGALDTAIAIFTNNHPKKFLTQLVASQLDMDRLDYLKRDSMFTGVSEGSIGIDRIIKTMRVFQGNIVIEKKGIYAIENYITARRLMYMQVYQHKTTLSADKLLRGIFKRVSRLLNNGEDVFFASPGLRYFLTEPLSARKNISQKMMQSYARMDDHDIITSIKYWQDENDPILSDLCRRFLNRDFFRTTFSTGAAGEKTMQRYQAATVRQLKKQGLPHDDESVAYYLFQDYTHSEAYKYENESIWILDTDNTATEFSKASDTKNILALTETVVKHYVVHLKSVDGTLS